MGGPNAHATRGDWERWITHDRHTAVVEAVLQQHREDHWIGSGRTSDEPIEVRVEISARSSALPHNGPRAAPTMAGKFADRTAWGGGGGGWFSASFGPSRRFSGADPEMDRLYFTHPRLASHLTAFGESVALGECLRATTLPLDKPVPEVEFEGKKFCLTGNFSGDRKECAADIEARGGTVQNHVSGKTDYLVIGEYASPAWKQSSYGGKIEKAVELKAAGKGVKIISERTLQENFSGPV